MPIGAAPAAISSDGKFVVFLENLDLRQDPPTPANTQIYRRELSTGRLELVTIDLSGQPTSQSNLWGAMTRDGQFVAFASREDDLVPSDLNGQLSDVFVRDMATGITELASIAWNGGPTNDESLAAALSANARYVAYTSFASNLVLGDTNGCMDLFVYDRVAHLNERVDVSTAGVEADYGTLRSFPNLFPPVAGMQISQDGRYVVFGCSAQNLVSGDTNLQHDVFVRDRLAGTTNLLVQPAAGIATRGTGAFAWLSDDGRTAAFYTRNHDLVAGAAPFAAWEVVVCDLISGAGQVASIDANGQPQSGYVTGMSMSTDGRYVAFDTDDDGIVAGDVNGRYDTFVRDVPAGTTTRVSNGIGSSNSANDDSRTVGMSGDGKLVLIGSSATDLVAGNLPGGAGVVVVDRSLSALPAVTFCTAKTNSQGCVPAIAPLGLPSISGNYAFFVSASNVLVHRNGALMWGASSAQLPYLGGTLCVQPPLRMTAPVDSHGNAAASTCSGWYSFAMTPQWMQARGWSAGTTIYCQYVCRDPALGLPNSVALTEGLRFTVVP